MRSAWQVAQARAATDGAPFTDVPPVLTGSDDCGGPTPHTTGLGLPLSRALAKAGGGWLGA